jgi:cell division protein FtsB
VKGRVLLLAVLGAATLVTLTYGGQSLARVWQMKHEVESLEREISTLRAEAGRLTATVNRLRDPTSSGRSPARISAGEPGERVLKLQPTPGPRGR